MWLRSMLRYLLRSSCQHTWLWQPILHCHRVFSTRCKLFLSRQHMSQSELRNFRLPLLWSFRLTVCNKVGLLQFTFLEYCNVLVSCLWPNSRLVSSPATELTSAYLAVFLRAHTAAASKYLTRRSNSTPIVSLIGVHYGTHTSKPGYGYSRRRSQLLPTRT